MEDAIIERPKETQTHAFFKQFKRKQPSDFKGAAGAAPNKNTRADAGTSNDAVQSTSTAEDIVPTILGNDNENEEPAIPEIRLNANTDDELLPPETMTDISDEELEYHLSHLERDSIDTIIHSGMNGRVNHQLQPQRQDAWEVREKDRSA